MSTNNTIHQILADQALVIPSHSTTCIQEAHILIGHILCEIIEIGDVDCLINPCRL
jgi:hypothetical protein